MDRRTFLAGLGSLAVGSGAILDASAVTTVGADRSADVQTAADPSALLGLDGVDDAGTTPTFTNNSDGTMVVELSASGARFDVGDTGSFQNETATFELGAGVTRQVVIDGDSGPVSVSVDAEIEDDDGTVVGSISLQRNYALQTTYEVPPAQTENGDIDTGSDVVVGENGQVKGSVDSGGSVSLDENAQVKGSIGADGNVSLGENAQAKDSVDAGGNVSLGENAQIKGTVEAGGSVTLGENAQVKDSIVVGGNLSLGENAQVKGTVEAGGSVTLGENAQIKSDVTAGGTVYLGCNAQVNGEIDAADTVDTC